MIHACQAAARSFSGMAVPGESTHRRRPISWRSWAVSIMHSLVILLIAADGCAQTTQGVAFEVQDRRVLVTTPSLVATFEDGALVALRSPAGEVFASDAAQADWPRPIPYGLATTLAAGEKTRQAIDGLHPWAGAFNGGAIGSFQHRPGPSSTLDVKPLADGRRLLTWHGLRPAGGGADVADESFSLEISIDAKSGDLEVVASATGAQKGVYGCGLAMANFSRELTCVLPVLQGFSFRPADHKPLTFATHWPHPWAAAMLVLQGQAHSAAIWSADPKMGDRYLFLSSGAKAMDLAIESINAAPFDGHTSARSAPIHISVRKGGWAVAAEPFRQWWAGTFAVKPLADRQPAYLKDLFWVSDWGALPPADIAKQAVHFSPQVWKKGPTQGDTGLFPCDMSNGPEVDQLGPLLPRLKDLGCEPFVYVNISHISRAHPLAPKYWPHRIQPPFRDPRIEEDPKFGSPDSFVVNTADKAWQDLMVDWTTQIHKKFGIVGFYMDCAAGVPNSSGGLIDGRNDCQGQVELMKRQRQAVPGCFLGSEYVSEVTAQTVDLAGVGYDQWFDGGDTDAFPTGKGFREAHVHPILSFLFGPYTHLFYFGHLTPAFEETLGRLPLTTYPPRPPGTLADFSQLQSFHQFWGRLLCSTKMRPTFPDPWEPKTRAYYADPSGNKYRIVADTPAEGRMLKTTPAGAEELVYWRTKGRREAALAAGKGIDGWVAYDGNKAIGLDPTKEYLYLGGKRAAEWEVTQLPPETFIRTCRPHRNGLLALELATYDGKKHEGEVTVLATSPVLKAIVESGGTPVQELPTQDGRKAYRMKIQAPGTIAFACAPPKALTPDKDGLLLDLSAQPIDFLAPLSPSGIREVLSGNQVRQPDAKARQVFVFPNWTHSATIDYLFTLPPCPPGKKLQLELGSWVSQEHKINRYDLVIEANGKVLLRVVRQGGTAAPRHVVDLTPWAERDLLLTIRVENAALFEWARLLEPAIVAR